MQQVQQLLTDMKRDKNMVDLLYNMLQDADGHVVANCVAVLDEINRPMAELDAACELRNDRPMPLGRSRRRLTVRLESIDDAPIEQPP